MVIDHSDAMDHGEWTAAAAEELRRLLELAGGLDADQWSAPTDCAGWDVRAMLSHVAGAAQWSASLPEFVRQQRHGRRLRQGGDLIDGVNAWQVLARADRTPQQLIDELRVVGPRALQARARIPRLLRRLPLPFGPPLGRRPLGYLLDCILTRDTWLHRIDICRAIGREPLLTEGHDGRIVGDVVADWSARHGRAFDLQLTGPAGGAWQQGEGGEAIVLDAVEYCRILSGRASGTGLLATPVPF